MKATEREGEKKKKEEQIEVNDKDLFV